MQLSQSLSKFSNLIISSFLVLSVLFSGSVAVEAKKVVVKPKTIISKSLKNSKTQLKTQVKSPKIATKSPVESEDSKNTDQTAPKFIKYHGNGKGLTLCKDGMTSKSAGRGTCSGHGGIDK